VAYRLFFLTVAEPPFATAEQRRRQRAWVRTAGLKEEDVQSAADVLETFKSEYDELVARYNESVRVATEAGASVGVGGTAYWRHGGVGRVAIKRGQLPHTSGGGNAWHSRRTPSEPDK
jgi:hypothetical protein